MNNTSSSASFAITEKKKKMVHPKSPVGCIAVFFQFLARRKLFSRKLLTNGRPAPKTQKKLGGGEKRLPVAKKLLIENENSGGFQPPGVVAKLMGLDSVPIVPREKPKESSQSEVDGVRNEASETLSAAKHQKVQNLEKKSERPRYYHKFTTNAKNPRSLSGMNKAQLLEAATEILDHGFGSRNQSATSRRVSDASSSMSKLDEASNDSLCSSCRNSGEIVELRLSGEQEGRIDRENTKKNVHVKSKLQKKATASLPVQGKGTVRNAPIISSNRCRNNVEDKTHAQNNQQTNMPKKNVSSNSALKQNNLKQNQLSSVNKEVVPRSVMRTKQQQRVRDQNTPNGAKNFVALNKNLNYCAYFRSKIEVSDRMDSTKGSLENKNIVRKKWSNKDIHNENAGILKSKFAVERAVEKDLIKGKGARLVRKTPISRNHATSDLSKNAELGNVAGNKDSGILSFTFRSPMKHVTRPFSSADMEERRDICESVSDGSHPEVMPSDAENYNSLASQKEATITPKASCQRKRNGWTYRTSILDDLKFDRKGLPSNKKDDAKTGKSAAFRARDSDHPSPISLLETSFRHDSLSGSSNRSTGGKPPTCLKESSITKRSASPVNVRKLASESNPNCTISNTTRHDTSTFEVAIQESKLRYSEEVTSNAELLLESISYFRSERTKSSLLAAFLNETIECILNAFGIGTACTISFGKGEAGNSLRNLVLDFIIECLASLYCHYCNSGYNSWLKVLLFSTRDRLVAEIEKEMESWYPMIGKAIEDLVEKDFDKSTEFWIDFSIEAFQIGMQIEDDMLQILIDEVVLELSQC